MTDSPSPDKEAIEALHLQLAEQERVHAERIRQMNAALAAAQDRSYWLDRWQIDLNELMRRPGASEARAALRALRSVYRTTYEMRNRARALPLRLAKVQGVVQDERRRSRLQERDVFGRTIPPDPPVATPVTDLLNERPDEVPGLTEATDDSGSTYYADLVVEAAEQTGFRLEPGLAGLEFRCSHGQVVGVLATAYPNTVWTSCDRDRPPLPYEDESVDLVFSITAWAHLGENAAGDWLVEMQRLLRRGGRLVLATHGLHSIAHAAANGLRPPSQLREIERTLYRDGFWFARESDRDDGRRDPEWGTAFLTPEWVWSRIGAGWRVSAFHPGRVRGQQDLYVLEPR